MWIRDTPAPRCPFRLPRTESTWSVPSKRPAAGDLPVLRAIRSATSRSTGNTTRPPARRARKTAAGIETTEHGEPRLHTDFYRADCPACPACPAKLRHTNARLRVLTLRPRKQHEALQRHRSEQETNAWKARYTTRAGIEDTISQAAHRTGARRTRYRGPPKARLHTTLAAAALNLIRLDAWPTGTPLANTQTSHFSQLPLTLAA